MTDHWQELVDIAAAIIDVPSCLITQVKGPNLDILISSKTKGTPYIAGESLQLSNDVYSEYVIKNRKALLIADAQEEAEWAGNPDVLDYGMVSYFGLPLYWPDGEVFGTLCILDRKKNGYTSPHLRMLEMFQNLIIKDLVLNITVPLCNDDQLHQLPPGITQQEEQHDASLLSELKEEIDDKITRLKVSEEALAEERRSSRSKSDFMANMSLELRSPLNAIIGFSELIKNENFGPVGQECYRNYANDILNSGKHLLSVIDDVLDVSKVATGSIELRETECDLIDLSASCLRMVTSRAVEKGVTLSDFSERPQPLLYADPVRLKQILNNLLSNAIKFTSDKGSITLCTHVSDAGQMIVEISDTGAGIPQKALENILKPFNPTRRQADNQESTGLGLSIVKSMMDLHGGSIELISSVGVGTTALLTFPKNRVMQ
ncbi:GAF domain-containing sensor histidine kinase [Kiloniella sp.]|uniref:GAF domain-containing sensor histidine kinase n=1 Tax=Kiloniella sp. TaxID=1938587 RepID=UPI003B01E89F